MKQAIQERVRIEAGGVIEITHPELQPGEEVEVIVMLDPASEKPAEVASPRSSTRLTGSVELGWRWPEDWAA